MTVIMKLGRDIPTLNVERGFRSGNKIGRAVLVVLDRFITLTPLIIHQNETISISLTRFVEEVVVHCESFINNYLIDLRVNSKRRQHS